MSSITEMERRLKLSFRRHPLVALGLALSFVVAAAVPAGATYYTEEERPGIQTWAPFHMTEKVEFDYFRPLQGNVYKVTWTLRGECGDGSLFSSGNVSPGSFRGLEFDANAPSSLFSNYFTASDDVTTIQTTGFNGTEGVYRDTNFLDSGTARLGWGVYNAQNMTECTAAYIPILSTLHSPYTMRLCLPCTRAHLYHVYRSVYDSACIGYMWHVRTRVQTGE